MCLHLIMSYFRYASMLFPEKSHVSDRLSIQHHLRCRMSSTSMFLLLFINLICLLPTSNGTEFDAIEDYMTNSTSLTCNVLSFRSHIDAAVACGNDKECRATWTAVQRSGAGSGTGAKAVCYCVTTARYGALNYGVGDFYMKNTDIFRTGKCHMWEKHIWQGYPGYFREPHWKSMRCMKYPG